MLLAHTAKSTMRYTSSTLVVLLIFPGCATRPISNAEAVDAPMERILAPGLLTPFQTVTTSRASVTCVN